MALKTTIAAGLAAITMALFAGNAAEAKTKVVIGIGTGGWGAHSCWGGWRRNCGWHPRSHYYYHGPRRVGGLQQRPLRQIARQSAAPRRAGRLTAMATTAS